MACSRSNLNFYKIFPHVFYSSKEVIAVFKVIMSMLGFSQEQKDNFDLKLKEFGKKSAFAKLL